MVNDFQTAMLKNKETTITVVDALFSTPADRRIKAAMKFSDALLLAAKQVKLVSFADLTKIAPSFFFLSEKYEDPDCPTKKKVRYKTAYRLGDMGLAPSLWLEKDDGKRSGYLRCCAWLTAEGLFLTHCDDPISCNGILIKDPVMAARQNDLICMAPGFPGHTDESAMDPETIRDRWSRNITETFFPLMSDVAASDVSFKNDWMYSKADIFTMTLVNLFSSVLAKAASYNLDALDWIIYRLYACISECNNNSDAYKGTGIWNPKNWLQNLLSPKDIKAVNSALEITEGCSIEDFMFMAPPMDEILTEVFLKRIEQFSADEKRLGKGNVRQPNSSDYSAQNIKDALIAQKTITAYWSFLAGTGNPEKNAAVEKKFDNFFSNLSEKDCKILEDIRNDIHKFRKSQTYLNKAKEKKEFYIKNALAIPKSFTKWLAGARDIGAVVDSLSLFTTPEYEFLKEFAAREALVRLNEIEE